MKPEFVDNRELLLVDALRGHLEWLQLTYRQPIELSIASGYFNPAGFALLAEKLEQLSGIRLLLGAEPTPPPALPLRHPGEPKGERFERKIVDHALAAHEAGLRRDRDLVPFTSDADRSVRRLLDFLASGRIEVRRYEKAFLHGKAFIFSSDEGVIAGSSNFTAAGLTSNLELNLGRYDPTPVRRVRDWFDSLWEQAAPYDLASVYAPRYEPHEPYLVYLRVLWERYRDELDEEPRSDGRIVLTTFQNDGIFRAKRICRRYNGVLIADGVGLGKSFVAGEMIREALEDRRQRALLICPATLRDGTWARFASAHMLHMETISYEQLADEKQLGGNSRHLEQDANAYSLVVVDEVQAFRNPDTNRARALRRLLQGTPPKTLVLLSATPVNNSLWDLYYLLTYFIGHDAEFSDIGIRSLRDRFAEAVRVNPDDLRPDALFDLIDATTVRRTRRFVRRYYPNDRVRGPGGVEIPVTFPTPHVQAVTYSLDEVLPGFFEEFAHALAPPGDNPTLTLARYCPGRYAPRTPEDPREAALVGLLRSGLLKRFESSAHAFAKTAEKMARGHEVFLEGLNRGYILTSRLIEEWEQTDSDEAIEELLDHPAAQPLAGHDVDALRADVEQDRDTLRRFAHVAGRVRAEADPKLAKLVEALAEIAGEARREGLGEKDRCDRRKVIIFSFYSDTVEWIYKYLTEVLAADRRLADYRGRMVAVAGDETLGGVSRETAVFGFAPQTSEAPSGSDDDRFDILLTTDVLAEGVNLQQARHIINYDLPWNPMRLVQRHGRIDRIGSPHRDVFIRCFFPDQQLDALLELETRIRRKVAQAAASVGVEYEVIPGAAVSERVFADVREEIEALRREDAEIFENAGEDPAAHSGEEYRQELRKGLERYGDRVKNLPWGSGSGLRGPERGHFFCARVGESGQQDSRLFLRFVPWSVHEIPRESIIRETLGCLKRIACAEGTATHLPADLAEGVYSAWQVARRDIWEEWALATDPANLQPKVRPALRAAADHLRRYPPPDVTQEEMDRLVERLEAPLGARKERTIREAMEGAASDIGKSKALVARIQELGLEPYHATDPLPPIDEDEVSLLCWLAVDTESLVAIAPR